MMKQAISIAALALVACGGVFGQQTYSNGPLVTHPGQGLNGLDASALDTGAPLLNIFGWGASAATNTRVIDDFKVPYGQTWTLQTISGFTYQTTGGPPSTITAGNYRIWNGSPLAGGAIIHDFSASNQMTATNFTNIYRVLITTLGDVARPIMQVDMAGNGITLTTGTYWLDIQFAGNTALSGPWVPPVTTYPAVTQGNGLQNNAGPWVTLADGVPLIPQAIPFLLTYTKSFTADISQPGGAGNPVVITDVGTPFATVLNAATLYQGAFPNGWLFGCDIPILELSNIISFGQPFVAPLNAAGNYSISIPISFPFPVTVYYVGVELQGPLLLALEDPKSSVLQ